MRPAFLGIACFLISMAFAGGVLAENRWVRVKGGSWEPTATVLNDAKTALEPYIKGQAKNLGRELRNWREYTFQYQGSEEKGRRYLFINALCRSDSRWKLKDDFQMVFDGGSCYFHLKYEPTRREFSDLIINGDA